MSNPFNTYEEDAPRVKLCPQCHGVMRLGKAIATEGQEERVCFFGVMHSGKTLVSVLKCRSCGHSVSVDHPLHEIAL
jgi:hypothetical protein